MTLSELAAECRELAMRGKGVLYDRGGHVGDAISDAMRKVTLYKPKTAADWPKTAVEAAKRRFNPKTDVKISYTRQAGDRLALKKPRRSKVRRVEELQSGSEPSMAGSRGVKKLEKLLLDHADKRKLHLTTVADPYGSQRVSTEGLARHYKKAGFKDRTSQAKKRERMRLANEGHSGSHVDDSLNYQFDGVKVMHRKPKK